MARMCISWQGQPWLKYQGREFKQRLRGMEKMPAVTNVWICGLYWLQKSSQQPFVFMVPCDQIHRGFRPIDKNTHRLHSHHNCMLIIYNTYISSWWLSMIPSCLLHFWRHYAESSREALQSQVQVQCETPFSTWSWLGWVKGCVREPALSEKYVELIAE